MSTLKVDTIATTAGVTNNRVLQIQSTQVSTTTSQTITTGVLAEITNMSVNITPLFSNSKILLQAQWMGEFTSSTLAYNSIFSFKRNDTYLGSLDDDNRYHGIMPPAINLNSSAASTTESSFLMYMDTPSTTSAITYKLSIIASGGTVYNNRTVTDSNSGGYERGMSMITATEIAQ